MGTEAVDYEVVVALTECSHQTAELLKGIDKVRVVPAPLNNLSASSCIGIEATQYDKVVLLDADVKCAPGYLQALDSALNDNALVRSNIQFDHNSWATRIVAEMRTYVYASGVFYCPGAALQKGVREKIGGHFFNDAVWWTEDAEMNFRIKNAGIPVHFAEDAVLRHAPEPMLRDLRGAQKIGRGKYSQVQYAGRDTFEEGVWNTLQRVLTGESFKRLADIAQQKGPDVAVYNLGWNFMYYLGYYRSLLENSLTK